MNSRPVLVKKIRQKDNHTFTIEWSDGVAADYRLNDLQRMCPCAHCVDEMTGKRLLNANSVRDDVRASRVINVGRYALRVQFTSGCSTGIYSFTMLRQMVL
jgi:DUF971 family protein